MKSYQIDIETVARAALPHLAELCRRWLPNGRRMGREWAVGDLTGAPGQSCRVNLSTGRWADFATGQRGGDAVSLAAAIHRLSQREAAERLARALGMGGAADGR